ncbi:unnamed protein product [Rotaria sp. Silwood1]|nr:unnamed protein product [Rotaria sp. Silwood1]CAF1656578.1 unnamed protein product [Rotaria sp. Silwood1]
MNSDDQNKENIPGTTSDLALQLKIKEEETKQMKIKKDIALAEKDKALAEKDKVLAQERMKKEETKQKELDLQYNQWKVPQTPLNQPVIRQGTIPARKKRSYLGEEFTTKRAKTKAKGSSSSTDQSTIASNIQSTDTSSTCSKSASTTTQSMTWSNASPLCPITKNEDFYYKEMANNISEFEIHSLLNDSLCSLNDDVYNNNIELRIKNYLEDIQNSSNSFESFNTILETTLQTAFDKFMDMLLKSFENYTVLKYINSSKKHSLDGCSPDCSYIFKNVSIKDTSISKVLSNFLICFGELKTSTNGNFTTATIGEIGRYFNMLNKSQGWRRIYAFLYDFYTITFFYCEKMSNKDDLQYYQSKTLKLIEDDPVKRSNFDVIKIDKESKEIYFSKENWKIFIKFLTMKYEFYHYEMLNIIPSDYLLGDSYEIIDRLGKGATSIVYLLQMKNKVNKSKKYVMKILRKHKFSWNFEHEMKIIKELRKSKDTWPVFPNIIDLWSSGKIC